VGTGEFDLVAEFRRRFPLTGDDAAMVDSPEGTLLLAADAIVAGVDFDPDCDPVDVGYRAVLVNASDIAAMGGEPRHLLVSVIAPAGVDILRLMDGVAEGAGVHGCEVAGGDLSATEGPLVVSVAITGTVPRGAAVRRSGARAGDLVYVTGDVGVGAGIIVEGRVLRGATGFAGEVGHMPLDPEMRQCACGRLGCWETMVGLAAFLRLVADPGDPVLDPSRALEERLEEIHRRADEGDARTLEALRRIALGVGSGVSLLADVFDPRLIVLGGYFAFFSDHLTEPVTAEIRRRALTEMVPEVTASTLGLTSAARGGAHLALESVFRDPGAVDPPRAASRPA